MIARLADGRQVAATAAPGELAALAGRDLVGELVDVSGDAPPLPDRRLSTDGSSAQPALRWRLPGGGAEPVRPDSGATEGKEHPCPQSNASAEDSVEILTINRPEARNAINGDVSVGMAAALDELEADDGCAVVVVTGAGDKAFSAGMDLKAFASGEGASIMGGSGGFAGITQREFPKPIIAAVNGAALAGGCEIMLSCDLVVAADHATFGIPEAKRGLVAGAGGSSASPSGSPSPSPSSWR